MKRNKNCAISRLQQDYLRLKRDPVPYVVAEPLPSNLLEWHYVVRGPENTPYEGGIYHGKLEFPKEFPFKPPSIYMLTPNGRFKVNTRICLSISDFHPDTWNPAWSVATILTGLLSFMVEKNPTLGSIETSDVDKRRLANLSLQFNINNRTFCKLFPGLCKDIQKELAKRHDEWLKQTVDTPESLPDSSVERTGTERRILATALNTFGVAAGCVVFAYVFKYVIATLE